MMSESKHNRRLTERISDARLFTRIILIYTISTKKSREKP